MKTQFLALLAAGLLLLSGCEKEPDLVDECAPAVSLSQHTLASFWSRNGAPVQTFTFNNSNSYNFTSAKGNQVSIPANSFVRPDGSALPANTTVQLAFREIETKAEMVLSNMPTASNGQPLESGGEYYFKGTLNGTTLRMSQTGRVFLQTPVRPSVGAQTDMQVFWGQTTNQGINWIANQDTASSVVTVPVFSPTGNVSGYGYSLFLKNDSLRWVNCDAFINANPRTTFFVDPRQLGGTTANTVIYLVFRNRNSVLPGTTYSSTTAGVVASFPNVPVGEAVSAVAIRYSDNKYYYGRQDGTITTQGSLIPTMRELSEADLIAEIRRL